MHFPNEALLTRTCYFRFLISWHDPRTDSTLYLAKAQSFVPPHTTSNRTEAGCGSLQSFVAGSLSLLFQSTDYDGAISYLAFGQSRNSQGNWKPANPPGIGYTFWTNYDGA